MVCSAHVGGKPTFGFVLRFEIFGYLHLSRWLMIKFRVYCYIFCANCPLKVRKVKNWRNSLKLKKKSLNIYKLGTLSDTKVQTPSFESLFSKLSEIWRKLWILMTWDGKFSRVLNFFVHFTKMTRRKKFKKV